MHFSLPELQRHRRLQSLSPPTHPATKEQQATHFTMERIRTFKRCSNENITPTHRCANQLVRIEQKRCLRLIHLLSLFTRLQEGNTLEFTGLGR